MAEHQLTAEEQAERLQLEDMLARFYSPEISNTQRTLLEAELRMTRSKTFTWKYCLDNLNTFDNQHLWFFGSSTLEIKVSKWFMLPGSERDYIRAGLIKLLSNYPPNTPALQRDKVAQLLANVARLQFPEEYPDYIDYVLFLMKDRFPIGLALARALGDSITQDCHVKYFDQQKHFVAAVAQYIPGLLCTLEAYCKYYLSSVLAADRPLSEMDDRNVVEQCTIELLQILQQYFTWIELCCVEPSLVDVLLQMGILRQGEEKQDVAISAVSALSELYYRQQPLSPETAKHLAAGIVQLLRQPGLQQSDELYQDKLADLVRLSVGRELPSRNMLYWQEFYDLLYHFTFETRSPLTFVDRLGMWQAIFNAHREAGQLMLPDDLLMRVALPTLERMFFQNDVHQQLERLGDDEVDENLETEIQHYYNRCIEVVEAVAEIAPQAIYQTVLSTLITNEVSPYRRGVHILKTLCTTGDDGIAELCNNTNLGQLRATFKDFIPVGQILGRLCAILKDKVSDEITGAIRWLTREQVELFVMMSRSVQPVDHLYMRMPSGLSSEMIPATAQMLTTIRSLLPLNDLKKQPESGSSAVTEQNLVELIEHVTNYLAPPVQASQNEWSLLAGAAANFLLQMATGADLVNPRVLFKLLCGPVTTCRLAHLDYQTAHALRKAVCHTLLAPWSPSLAALEPASSGASAGQGESAERSDLLKQYVRFLANDLLCVKPREWPLLPSEEQRRVATALAIELAQLTDLLTHFRQLSSVSKGVLAGAFRCVIEAVLGIYEATEGAGLVVSGEAVPGDGSSRSGSMANTLLEFCHAMIDSLQVQLGEPFLQHFIRLFLQRARAEAAAKQQLRSLEALLGILVLIVEQPGNRSLIPDIVHLCVEDVLPVAFAEEYQRKPDSWRHSELCVTLFRLFHAIFLHRSKYFVPSQLHQQPSAQLANEAQYVAIMNGYGMVIESSRDSQLRLTVLESLQTLHERSKLFRQPFFVERFLHSFMTAIFALLLSLYGGIFIELLIALLFEMCRVDQQMFFNFAATLSRTVPAELLQSVCQSTDLPTFTTHLNELVSKVRSEQPSTSSSEGSDDSF